MKKLAILFPLMFFTSVLAQTDAQKFDQAMTAYNSKEYFKAVGLFEHFFSGHNLYDELYATAKYYYGDALLNLGEFDASAGEFEFLVNNYKWSNYRERALYKLGLVYYQINRFDNCRTKLEKLLDEYPSSEFTGSALYWIGESYSSQGRIDDAVQYFTEAVHKKQNNKFIDYTLYTLASLYEKKNDYQNAVKYYDQLLSYYPNSSLALQAQIRIGVCYFKLNDYQSSIIELNNPTLAQLDANQLSERLYLLGNSYYRVEDFSSAAKTYLKILKDYPSSNISREAQYSLAWTYFQQKKYENSFNLFNSLSDGTDSIAIKSFFWKAESKRYDGKDLEAFNIYRDFLQKFPDAELVENVQYQMGLFYFNNKKFDLAQKYLNAAKVSKDKLVQAKAGNLIGEIDLEVRQYSAAKKDFQSVLNMENIPDNQINRASLGMGAVLYYLKDFNGAVKYLDNLQKQFPEFEPDKVNFYLAESNFSLKKYSDAIKYYNQVNGSPDELYSDAVYGKAYSYFYLNEFENAAQQFYNFVIKFPKDNRAVDARLRLADSYYGAKNFGAASRVYKDMFNVDKEKMNDAYTYYQYAQALFRAGKSDEAKKEFGNLQLRFPSSEYAAVSLYTEGWINFQQNNYEGAVSTYKNVLSIYPNSSLGPILYYSIGDSYFNIGRYDSAIVNYQKVISKFPRSNYVFDAVNGIQYCYVAQGQTKKAIKLIDQFVSQNPGLSFSDQIFFKKGETYYGIRDYENAKLSYKEFVADYPNSKLVPDGYYWIGKCAQMLKQNQEAIFNFNKVFNEYPGSESAAAAVIEMGNIYNDLKEYDSAVVVLDKAIDKLQNSPRIPELLFMKGNMQANQNDVSGAFESYNMIVEYYSGSIFAVKAKLEIGIIDLAANKFSDATELFSDLAQSRSDDLGAKAQYYLGLTLFDQQNYEDALTELDKVHSIFSTYDEWITRADLLSGDCYVELKNFSEAKKMYRAVISKHRSDIFGKEAQKKLRQIR